MFLFPVIEMGTVVAVVVVVAAVVNTAVMCVLVVSHLTIIIASIYILHRTSLCSGYSRGSHPIIITSNPTP